MYKVCRMDRFPRVSAVYTTRPIHLCLLLVPGVSKQWKRHSVKHSNRSMSHIRFSVDWWCDISIQPPAAVTSHLRPFPLPMVGWQQILNLVCRHIRPSRATVCFFCAVIRRSSNSLYVHNCNTQRFQFRDTERRVLKLDGRNRTDDRRRWRPHRWTNLPQLPNAPMSLTATACRTAIFDVSVCALTTGRMRDDLRCPYMYVNYSELSPECYSFLKAIWIDVFFILQERSNVGAEYTLQYTFAFPSLFLWYAKEISMESCQPLIQRSDIKHHAFCWIV